MAAKTSDLISHEDFCWEWPTKRVTTVRRVVHVQQALMCIFVGVQSCWVQAGPKIEFYSLFFFFLPPGAKMQHVGDQMI